MYFPVELYVYRSPCTNTLKVPFDLWPFFVYTAAVPEITLLYSEDMYPFFLLLMSTQILQI